MVDGIGQRYHVRPSAIIGIQDEEIAFDFDVTVAVRASELEKGEPSTMEAIQKRQKAGFDNVRALQERVKLMRSEKIDG